jgi:Uma2 family endonuclease
MASLPNPTRVTYEEWLKMPVVEDGREEVVDGEIIFMPPAKSAHALIIDNIGDELKRQLPRPEHRVLTSSFGIVIREKPLTCRNPDVVVFRRASMVEKDGYFRSAPQLAVEVLSPSETRRMTDRKIRDYEAIAVPEVWIVSPQEGTVEVIQFDDGQLRTTSVLTNGILKPREFPHVQVDIAQIWPD